MLVGTMSRRIGISSSMKYTATAAAHTLCCAVVYVSEGRNDDLLDSLASASASQEAALIRQFRDSTYHRTGFTIGGSPSGVAGAALEVSRRALQAIDLRLHEASHPRLGVVDHISIHPLGVDPEATVDTCRAGNKIAETLGQEGLPVLLYGDLNDGRRLAEVRRSTPYFSSGNVPDEIEADLGPRKVDPTKGISTIGCTPLVTNYNILLDTETKSLASAVTRSVREKDGGLPWVEALTLMREDGRYETACNLLRPKEATTAMVLAAAEAGAALVGVSIVDEYTTGLTEEEAMQAITRMLSNQDTPAAT